MIVRFQNERGAALSIALGAVAVVATLVVALFSAVQTEHAGVNLSHRRLQASVFAEGLSEIAEQSLLATVANYLPLPEPTAAAPHLVMEAPYVAEGVTGDWKVNRATVLDLGGEPVEVPPYPRTDPATGLDSIVESFEVRASARFGRSQATVVEHVEVERIPVFQFLAFYDSTLEILPGPPMTLSGRVHTNGDLHLGANSNMTVDTHYVRAAGDLYRHRKDQPDVMPGWIEIRESRTGGELVRLPSVGDLAALGIPSSSGLDSHFAGWDLNGDGRFDLPGEMPPFEGAVADLFNGTVQTSEHGVTPMGHPAIGSIQAYEELSGGGGDYVFDAGLGEYVEVAPGTGTHRKGYYHENADLVIIDLEVYTNEGTRITTLMPTGFLTERSLYDAREHQTITVTEIDLGRLGDRDGNPGTRDPSPYYPRNGLLFATRTDSEPGSPNAVVLTNGAELNVPSVWNSTLYPPGSVPAGAYPFGADEAQGLTVVTSTPLFVHGDYNSVSKKPAAVIADAVNLLSKAWNYSKAPGQLPNAASTTYNVAIVTGNHDTTPGAYNGGFENLPRFHESWSSRTCTIQGSFVNFWRSRIATGTWHYGGDVYKAPRRAWSFDTDFDEGRLPPFTPQVIRLRPITWDLRN